MMHDRLDAMPGNLHLPSPALYPSKPVQQMTRWRVSFVTDGFQTEDFRYHVHVWAYASTDAEWRARDEFFADWATPEDRERLPLLLVDVVQVEV